MIKLTIFSCLFFSLYYCSVSYSDYDCNYLEYLRKSQAMLDVRDIDALEEFSRRTFKECNKILSNFELAEVCSDIGTCLSVKGDHENAIKFYKSSIDYDYFYIKSRVRLVWSFQVINNILEAKKQFKILKSLYEKYYSNRLDVIYNDQFEVYESSFEKLKSEFE